MDSPLPRQMWIMRLAYLGLALAIMFFHLMPLDTVPRRWAPPDLLIALTLAWSLRRPEYVPTLVIAAVMLLADLLFQRPPGLLAMLVVLGSEYLKNSSLGQSDASFAGEWVSVSLVIVAMTLLNRFILGVLAVQQASFGLTLIQMVMTILAYPLVVLVTRFVMGVRKPAPREGRASRGRA